MSAKKTPKFRETISDSKTPRLESVSDYRRQFPSWQVSLLQMVDPWGWHGLEKVKTEEIRKKLSQFENKTWNTILANEGDRNHFIAKDNLCKKARDRLAEIGQDDVDAVLSLRLSGKERIYGILDMAVLKLLWWDPNHQICPAPKKHT